MPIPEQGRSDRVVEIAHQYSLLNQFETNRVIATILACLMMVVFLPVWLVVVVFGLDFLFEKVGLHLMRDLDPAQSPWRYRGALLSVFLMEAVYLFPAALIWQQESLFAKALAVGLVCMTLFQLASMRAIHLPLGIAGSLGVFAMAAAGNGYYWIAHGDVKGLAITTFAILGATYYAQAAMRSNHLLHRELIRRGRAADAASHAKGRFLAQMSHEIRTPLNAILGMGEAELADATDPRTKSRMQTLVTSAQDLAIILDDVLAMSAIDENALPIRPQPTDAMQVIGATVALFRPLYQAAHLTLDLNQLGQVPAQCSLDPHRLRQCLSNLLSNALKFTETGGVTVTVRMSETDKLEVDVADTGPGIAAADAESVFAPFNRGTGTRHGTGLGLTISRGLARQMGGDLVLLPAPIGARFQLTIAAPVLADAAAPSAKPVEAPRGTQLLGRHILVVDDIATNRLVASTHLQFLGATTTEADGGPAALTALQQEQVDAVLLDMNMPGMSGAETLVAIRALPAPLCDVRVLAMTADASEAHRRDYLALGLDGFVAKPLTAASLTQALNAALAAPGPL